MKKRTVVFLTVGVVLFILGTIIFVGAMSVMKWDFMKLDTRKFETQTHEFEESFNNISIKAEYTEVTVLLSENGKCIVECYEDEKVKHTVKIIDGTLEIKNDDDREWYEYISLFNFKRARLTVYLPESVYGSLYVKTGSDVKISEGFTFESVQTDSVSGDVVCLSNVNNSLEIEATSGDVRVENASVGSLEIRNTSGDIEVFNVKVDNEASVRVTSGEIRMTNVECGTLFANGVSSDVTLKNVVSSGNMTVKTVSGDVELEGIDGEAISIKTTTGDVEGYVYTDKTFLCKTTSGDCEYPKTSGGICEIETTSGDIEIKISR